MKFFRKVGQRLWSGTGESITEVLFALLISSLGLLLLAGMINAAAKITKNNRDMISSFVSAENAMAEREDSAKAGTGKFQFTLGDSPTPLKDLPGGSTDAGIPIQYYANKTIGGRVVYRYDREG